MKSYSKNTKTTHTLYVITSSTGRKYYGVTKSMYDRREAHTRDLRIGRHANKAMQADFDAGAEFTMRAKRSSLTYSQARTLENKLIRNDPTCYNEKGSAGYRPRSADIATRKKFGRGWEPALTPEQVRTVKNLLQVMYGYEVAREMDISTALVSRINTGKYTVKPATSISVTQAQ